MKRKADHSSFYYQSDLSSSSNDVHVLIDEKECVSLQTKRMKRFWTRSNVIGVFLHLDDF